MQCLEFDVDDGQLDKRIKLFLIPHIGRSAVETGEEMLLWNGLDRVLDDARKVAHVELELVRVDAEPVQEPSGCARAALYLRVSTGRHAQSDLPILDQRLRFSRGSSRSAQF